MLKTLQHARIQGFFGGDRPPPPPPPPPPPHGCLQFFLLVDLPRTLQQFGSAPEIPVRTPPPPSECTNPPPLLNPGSAPDSVHFECYIWINLLCFMLSFSGTMG